MGADGKVIGLDVSTEYTADGQRAWEAAGVKDKIDLVIGPAVESMQKMLDNGQAGTIDLIFIDADKGNYDSYYELGLKLLRPGGVIAIDNVFWHGEILDPACTDEDTVAIRTLNEKVLRDDRVDMSMLGIADGCTLCRKL
eukprot:NODE_3469_length_664_cov_270.177236_g2471_i0.p1 GENE.NODE_3469_length_664_cov_270.177236_g2471_i0~~NODE_3469_length_664_cov_270.177236_g2471_i0.p1  ORF type:complete len:148 (-),score=65.00 NODE_3469_length_664_cov_270.177236_g2471_i0:219-638(-)